MGVRILVDRDEDAACLYCSTDGVAFGRVMKPHGEELQEAFLQWYAKNGKHRDPRLDPGICDVQDAWLGSGCSECGVDGFAPCDPSADDHGRAAKNGAREASTGAAG